MQVHRYSAPDFDPYGDRLPEDDDRRPWSAPPGGSPLAARLSLPGSKSLTNRELVLAALADGPSVLRHPLHSRDSALMIDALRSLGARIDEILGDGVAGGDLRITPGELVGSTSIDAGLAGTVMRFIPPVAGLALGPVVIDGDPRARARPMRAVIEALRGLGVDVSDDGRGALPFTVHGTGRIEGGEIEIDASASSQFVSGLLLAAPRFEQGLTLRHRGARVPSAPHIEMTVAVLAERGVAVDSPEPGVWVVAPTPIRGRETLIEPDLSNAAPFLAAALIVGGTVGIRHWPEESTQVGARLGDLLARFGAKVGRDGDALVVDGGRGVIRGGPLPANDLDLSEAGELAPTFAALAALADAPSTISGIAHLRGHETDRLAALAAVFADLGGDVTELPDGLRVTPRPLHSGPWRVFDDHRMATTGALVGLAVPGVAVDDIEATAKTLPEFPDLWARMLGATPAGRPDPAAVA